MPQPNCHNAGVELLAGPIIGKTPNMTNYDEIIEKIKYIVGPFCELALSSNRAGYDSQFYFLSF